MKAIEYIKETPSTNELLWNKIRQENLPEGFVLYTDFQLAGKGQLGNSWESERSKNLLFSMVLYPEKIMPDKQFVISELVSVAIKNTLDTYCKDISIKWPNDIYWKDKKIGGILIENSLQGKNIRFSVIGIGLNVNQTTFVSNAPNPVSLSMILGKDADLLQLMNQIHSQIMQLYIRLDITSIHKTYCDMLYRKNGYHVYRVDDKEFDAKIIGVDLDGRLNLETKEGECCNYYFKEVSFVVC